jgi:preprotein translocase subunit SecD/SecD/SecF fusion protein
MDPKQRNALLIGITLLLVAVAWFQFWPLSAKINQGLDLRGGASVILTAQPENGAAVSEETMQRAETIVLNRVNGFGVSEASVQRQGTNQDSILVQLPGIKNPQAAIDALGTTGKLEFVDVAKIKDWNKLDQTAINNGTATLPPGAYPASAVIFAGSAITKASTGVETGVGGGNVVNLSLSGDAATKWGTFTQNNIGKQVAIVLDGSVKSAPAIQSAILDGNTQISGKFTPDQATQLAAILQAGALPVKLVKSDVRIVDATLGASSLHQGVLAVLAAFAIVALYLLVFYRGLGAVAWGALFCFASIYLGVLATLSQLGQFALSLPGLAGMALTVGLAADTSILMFERVKEEVRMGKTLRTAAKSGTKHALWTSVDADVVTFVSAAAIYLIAIGPVKGFALTLIIGIIIDLTVGFLFTRPIIQMLAETDVVKTHEWLFGMSKGGAENV